MNRTFLYRLFHHSKLGFGCVAIYLIGYIYFFSKKMDMLAYPYNDMFSHQHADSSQNRNEHHVQYLKLNNNKIPYTDYAYWKKDFLEQQNYYFAKYLLANNQNHVDFYINQKFKNKRLNAFLHDQLSPFGCSVEKWTKWYLQFSRTPFKKGDKASFVDYTISLNASGAAIIDSSTIFSFSIDE